MKRILALSMLAVVLGIFVTGCTKVNDFQWPGECYTVDGSLNAEAIIPDLIPDPAMTSLSLQVANTGAIALDVYTADQAMDVIDACLEFAEAADSYAELAAFIISRVSEANDSSGIVVFTTMAGQFTSYKTPIEACDLAIIIAHLEKQRAIVVSLGAVG